MVGIPPMAIRQLGVVCLVSCLTGCALQQQIEKDLATPAGQLFCAAETAGGPEIVALASAGGGAAVLATGAAEVVVNADCAAATASIAEATGPATPISPPPAGTPVKTVNLKPVTSP